MDVKSSNVWRGLDLKASRTVRIAEEVGVVWGLEEGTRGVVSVEVFKTKSLLGLCSMGSGSSDRISGGKNNVIGTAQK
jgi:hypothetical protein